MRVPQPPPHAGWRAIQRPGPSEGPRRQKGRAAIEIPNSARAGVTLLIVEDEILAAISLKDELEDAGYHVLDLTGHPDEALAAVSRCQPDLALVNIQLHGRDDGIELAGRLAAMGIPVLFISGQVSRAQSARSVAVGSLPKPYSCADMVRAVTYLLAHLQGDETCPRPPGLEVFDRAPDEVVPDAAA